MRALSLRLATIHFLLVLSTACGSVTETDTDCPRFNVTPEGPVMGFTAVGEWRSDSVCAAYCPNDYPVCQLATERVVRCQKGCG